MTIKKGSLSGKIINNRYKLSEVIGKGSYSDIIMARDMIKKEMLAVKFEKIKSEETITYLEKEYKFYLMIGSVVEGFPRIHYYGQLLKYKVMVMELLGDNLQSTFEKCRKHFTLKTIIYVFLQILQRIEHVHNCNLVFRDIKPENFMLGQKGSPKENIIHIIDFGLAKQYCDPKTKMHYPMAKLRTVTGTARYMSINSHLGGEQSRRDDLEAIGYMIMYFVRRGNLPWMGITANSVRERNKKIVLCKRSTPIDTLCNGKPKQFAAYLRYVLQLKYEEKPDYLRLRKELITLFQEQKFADDGHYDWN